MGSVHGASDKLFFVVLAVRIISRPVMALTC